MYDWRKMTEAEQAAALAERKARKLPWHSPPHFEYADCEQRFIVSAACFEHKSIIGKTRQRMADFESDLLDLCRSNGVFLYAWCLLPNHYHLLIRTGVIKLFLREVGKLHGSSSYRWNGEDDRRGRKRVTLTFNSTQTLFSLPTAAYVRRQSRGKRPRVRVQPGPCPADR